MAYFTVGSEAFLLGGSRPLAIAIGHRFSTFRIPHSTLLIPHSAFIILHSAFIIPHSAFLLYPPELTINTHVCRSGAPRCCHDWGAKSALGFDFNHLRLGRFIVFEYIFHCFEIYFLVSDSVVQLLSCSVFVFSIIASRHSSFRTPHSTLLTPNSSFIILHS